MLDNKWKHGKIHFELPPQLPSVLVTSSGIKAIPAILDNNVGEEIILLITEPQDKIEEFSGRDITGFMLKAGLVNTSFGPVCWLLFYFPSPLTGDQVTYENSINPKSYEHLSAFRRLSEQDYWHVIIADLAGGIVNLYEFPNNYGLSETLDQVESICANMQVTDFLAAKAEYESKYSIDELLAMQEPWI